MYIVLASQSAETKLWLAFPFSKVFLVSHVIPSISGDVFYPIAQQTNQPGNQSTNQPYVYKAVYGYLDANL